MFFKIIMLSMCLFIMSFFLLENFLFPLKGNKKMMLLDKHWMCGGLIFLFVCFYFVGFLFSGWIVHILIKENKNGSKMILYWFFLIWVLNDNFVESFLVCFAFLSQSDLFKKFFRAKESFGRMGVLTFLYIILGQDTACTVLLPNNRSSMTW